MSATVWSKFFWSDWESDEALKLCSPGAQALWMRMLCICSKADGYLVIAGQALDADAMAKSTGWPAPDVRKWWAELARWKVFSKTSRGKVYSRRMVKEAKRAETARENGKGGGNPKLRKDTTNDDWDNRFPTDPPGARPRINHLPSATEKGSNDPSLSPGKPVRARDKPKASPLGEGFPDSEAITAAGALIEAAGVRLDAADHAKRFRAYYVSRGRELADWGAAWVGWIEVEIGKAPSAGRPAPTAATPFVWSGPAGLWADVVAVMGLELARTYLGACEVRGDELVARRGVVFDRLKRDVPGPVAKSGLTLVLEREPAAASHPERQEQAA